MPQSLVAYTGMDAITHALAMKSIEMVKENLIKSFEGDTEARSEMHIAQCLAGMFFSNAILGIVHSMAHKTGKVFNIAHGCANAIYLPYVIEFNNRTASKTYADIAKRLGLVGDNEEELVNALIAMITDFNKKMNIPAILKDFGINEADFKASLEVIGVSSVGGPCTGTNPREISVEEVKKLFICTYYGEKVDF